MRFEFPSEIKKKTDFLALKTKVSVTGFSMIIKLSFVANRKKTVTIWIGKVNPQFLGSLPFPLEEAFIRRFSLVRQIYLLYHL